MRQTLRRSCAACAKSKHSCDLRTPRCSRCIKRRVQCIYANEPWSAQPAVPGPDDDEAIIPSLKGYNIGSLDPFDTCPRTRLPREHVQRLMYGFLHKIAFQYYPLDLSPTTNPFLVSWWPLALGDPALFHVSLQTACLDEELLAQKGFQTSELLMVDSVALLRRKIIDISLAVQDGTIDSVITLAAIEFGKGNINVAQMHVDGVKRLVGMRGGINSIRQTSPLTARMVSWVSMLIMGYPQFATQDDAGVGDGIPPIPEWQSDPTDLSDELPELSDDPGDSAVSVKNVFFRLRNVFQRLQHMPFPTTQIHDLTCFVIHRLLSTAPGITDDSSAVAESVRYAIILYMLIIQGPTYYSHTVIMNATVGWLKEHLQPLERVSCVSGSLNVWLWGIGLVASAGTTHYQWFMEKSRVMASSLQLNGSSEALIRTKTVLWLETLEGDNIFRPHWDAVLDATDKPQALGLTACSSCLA